MPLCAPGPAKSGQEQSCPKSWHWRICCRFFAVRQPNEALRYLRLRLLGTLRSTAASNSLAMARLLMRPRIITARQRTFFDALASHAMTWSATRVHCVVEAQPLVQELLQAHCGTRDTSSAEPTPLDELSQILSFRGWLGVSRLTKALDHWKRSHM